MPRYHFHVSDARDGRDTDGTELDGDNEARAMTLRYSGEIIASSTETFWHHDRWSMRVTDASNVTLFELQFAATMP
ncbi:MAG: hypothetical protein EOO77_40910 [Oxalobacteraceae bacterium]|nr:MAG: hypothetical protein EOO77_40910 [Oxalobacteraceae bacterium]